MKAFNGLDDLELLNNNSPDEGRHIYLTSRDDVDSHPPWMYGAKYLYGRQGNERGRSCTIIIVEKGQGEVDVFYFVFWAYNYGGEVLGQNLGMWLHGRPVSMY